ncbi:Conserved_hypothetical protein [Hexamita inflata]|uniref:Uncharacterized protein n=1 Tax=Hexamita inflata TaxID=28002 RepID=A0ABP1HCH8_9EUKA
MQNTIFTSIRDAPKKLPPGYQTLKAVSKGPNVYTYDESGHQQIRKTRLQQQIIKEFAGMMAKENDDILLMPAWDAVKNGFGIPQDNNNPYCINSNMSIGKGKNYTKQGRDVNSYSMVVNGKVPNIK